MSSVATDFLSPAILMVPEPLRSDVTHAWQAYVEAAQTAGIHPPANADLLRVLARVWACSPFVAQTCIRHPALLNDLLRSGELMIDYAPGHYVRMIEAALASVTDEADLGRRLRAIRRREMVRIAWRDIAGWAELEESLRDLSALAAACVDAALTRLHQWQQAEVGTPTGEHSGAPVAMTVLGMGKLGADELNFSSDIDLIFAYAEEGETRGKRIPLANEEYFRRLGRRLIAVLDDSTAEGRVWRVDMRLRPFGDAGPLAIAFDAMEEYYQSHGREWERYALIKAAVVAGDGATGAQLLKALRPFVYRRYLDFSAFESLREMKAMISRQVARKGLEDNIKLGAGGIREIEFIGQAYQLIRGGRQVELQARGILTILARLAQMNYLPRYVAEALARAYDFLRKAENRLQAMHDQQTHTLPRSEADRLRLACAMGFADWAAFERALRQHMQLVHEHFDQVFAAPQREQAGGDVTPESAWSGGVDAEAMTAALARLGYDDAIEAQRLLERLREGAAYRALTPQGRERLDRLMPLLLGAVARTAAATVTLGRVLQLIEAIVRRSAYIALLVENPMALSQLVRLCAASPWIATLLATHPVLLDELLDPRSLYAPLDRAGLEAELATLLARVADDPEQQLNMLRYFKQANVLRVAAADIAGAYPLMVVSDHLTEIAEVLLARVLRLAWDHLAAKHGQPREAGHVPGFIVVGYGKLGGIELGYGSDLDLVFLHGAGDEGQTDGCAPIDNHVFFARLGQRIIHLMTLHTAAGVLYEVDARLRPSGASGLLVSGLDAFADYQRSEAWTWEHQALVRARVVAGDAELAQRFEAVRREILARPRDPATVQREVRQMRERMRKELSKARPGQFDLKQDGGGIVDIEFIVQYAVLRWASEHPALLRWTDNIRLLETLAQVGLLAPADAERLAEAYRTYRAAAHRLTLQAQPARVAEGEFADLRRDVSRIWQELLEKR